MSRVWPAAVRVSRSRELRPERPSPDELLSRLQQQEALKERGRLKVFLGASAGVGKTYAMLSEAQEQRARGVDVIAGYVETHKRAETEALATELERLPMREVEYRGVLLKEFDIDAALKRAPRLILVDELAHTNIPGSRHLKRWEDIEELLKAGIDVYTAVNVQHLESLSDVVAQITGVQVRETVPDSFIERADEIEVVDIPPEELQQRLREGKVYVQDRIDHALEGFFQKGNLIALRELALRRAADRVDAQMQSYRAEQGVEKMWAARERALVCIAPNELAGRVVRSAARIAAASHAQLVAVYVESDRQESRSAEQQEKAREALRLAESLGMETVTLSGHDIVSEILRFANQRNITLIIVGKPVKSRWKELLQGSVVDELVRRSGEMDVHVITGTPVGGPTPRTKWEKPQPSTPQSLAWTVLVVALCTAVCLAMYRRLELSNLTMIYLMGVVFVAGRFGSREATLASILSVAIFDLAFVPPTGTFRVSDTQYIVTFAVMLAVALLISSLTLRLRRQASASAERERRTAALYSLSSQLAKSRSKKEITIGAANEIREVFDGDVAIFVKAEPLSLVAPSKSHFEGQQNEQAVAEWVVDHNEAAGKGTTTLPGAAALYVPLRGSQGAVGVLAFLPKEEHWPMPPMQRNLLETFANGLGLALERTLLAQESQQARVQAESERMRNSLLSSISHDLRTPLTAIAGAASTLKQGMGDPAELAETIYGESIRLNIQVQNLLDMTRLQSPELTLRLDWQSLEEVVGTAIQRTREILGDREVHVHIPEDLPLLNVDGGLIEKVFVNILENAAAHTPPATKITITARAVTERIIIEIADTGPGIPPGQEVRIFERSYRDGGDRDGGGFGLGLTICRTIMRLHDGHIWAKNRPEGGAVFVLELPKPKNAPEVPVG